MTEKTIDPRALRARKALDAENRLNRRRPMWDADADRIIAAEYATTLAALAQAREALLDISEAAHLELDDGDAALEACSAIRHLALAAIDALEGE